MIQTCVFWLLVETSDEDGTGSGEAMSRRSALSKDPEKKVTAGKKLSGGETSMIDFNRYGVC